MAVSGLSFVIVLALIGLLLRLIAERAAEARTSASQGVRDDQADPVVAGGRSRDRPLLPAIQTTISCSSRARCRSTQTGRSSATPPPSRPARRSPTWAICSPRSHHQPRHRQDTIFLIDMKISRGQRCLRRVLREAFPARSTVAWPPCPRAPRSRSKPSPCGNDLPVSEQRPARTIYKSAAGAASAAANPPTARCLVAGAGPGLIVFLVIFLVTGFFLLGGFGLLQYVGVTTRPAARRHWGSSDTSLGSPVIHIARARPYTSQPARAGSAGRGGAGQRRRLATAALPTRVVAALAVVHRPRPAPARVTYGDGRPPLETLLTRQ